ncbi:MAG: ferrous iron transport protein B [Acidobacteria bacterium]|nr:MAG: ferrous iron transport protein B [Acidobacteriota bacterium]
MALIDVVVSREDGGPAGLAEPVPSRRGIVLVGNPNVGKSALFGALTGAYATVSNYPGTTVEVTRAALTLDERRIPVVDTPGAASLVPLSEDERVTRDILLSGEATAVVVVGDAKNLERVLALALQVGEMGLPYVLCVNMMDEAEERGLSVDIARLSMRLGVPVVPTVAIWRQGIAELRAALRSARPGRVRVGYPEPVERASAALAADLPPGPVTPRALALLLLATSDAHADGLPVPEPGGRAAVDEARRRLARELPEPPGYAIHQARHAVAGEIAREARTAGIRIRHARRVADRLEPLTTHPVWGYPILAVILALAYVFVGKFGAGTLVGLFENRLFGGLVNPLAIAAAERVLPWAFARDLLVGPYGVITMALTYSLALVLPIVGTFFIAFGALEDSGYLPRLAVMVDGLFRRMGLNGKAVLPMVLGLGCDTMATLTTRILETRKERMIVILLLALGVPCSAQLTVVLALLGPLHPAAFVLWALVIVSVIILIGRLAAAVIPGRSSDFVLELPPLRLPRLGNIAIKTLGRIEWYLKEAVPLFVLGTLILFAADRLHLLGHLQRIGEPVVSGLLGLPPEAAGAFVVGFLRRDFGAAGLYALARAGRLDAVQALVAAVTITLFIPCIANFFMIVKERGWRTATAVAAFIIPFAVLVGAGLNALLGAVRP